MGSKFDNGIDVGTTSRISAIAADGTLYQKGTAITAAAAELNIMDGVTADKDEINKLDGVTAGTVTASKVIVVGANKNIDTLAIADGGLKLGADAGTAVTATAVEINAAADGLTEGKFVAGQKFIVQYPQIAAADVAKTFFIAPAACKIIEARERHVTVAGQAGTLQIEKLESGEAPGAGDALLSTAFDLTSTANTPVTKAAVSTAAATLAAGDCLCLKLASGAATSYALGTITVTMQWV